MFTPERSVKLIVFGALSLRSVLENGAVNSSRVATVLQEDEHCTFLSYSRTWLPDIRSRRALLADVLQAFRAQLDWKPVASE